MSKCGHRSDSAKRLRRRLSASSLCPYSVRQVLNRPASATMETTELCFPEFHNISCRKPQPSPSDALLSYSLISLISVLTVTMNLLVIISILHFRQLHSPTNLLILSLAVSDFLVGLLPIPVQILLTETCWLLGSVLCALYNLTVFTITASAVGSIVLISIDRYLAICDPLHYSTKVTLNRVKFCVCACWLCALFYCCLILKDFLIDPDAHSSCYGECVVVLNNITGNVDFVFTFIGPITVVVVLYVRIFMVVVSQARSMQSKVVTLQQTVTISARKSELKAARTLGIVILVFIVCLCPFYLPSFAGEHIVDSSLSTRLATWAWLFNSCVNPFVYAFFYPWFRKSIKLIVTFQILQTHSTHANVL
ncbi:trace amine-associated receptor 8b-like [Boleophthalmus pectinirostris]|uniref:trace amine-associated receptor 8b-like n=1 Tax=Boleophthalmus pectinirostris TaxID=150288 RepID=UPI0024320584|nr:trace amine-associated receptor 8b-like [Boleophthalmus pectinirostris]